jgi:predicted nucleotidyltransferase
MSLPRDLIEMLSAFTESGVRYLVVGGHAVSLHARPRSTKDLDLWLDAAPENIGRACAALRLFGVPPDLVAELQGARPDEIVWMGRIPVRVDFLQTLPGVDFEASWGRRVSKDIDGVPVTFIGLEDLLANKRAVGRPQDRRDVAALERATRASSTGAGRSSLRTTKTRPQRRR